MTPPRAPAPHRILIVDDDGQAREVLLRFLLGKGYEAKAVSSGKEGLALLEAFAPRLVLLDLNMPEMDGRTVLGLIRLVRPETAVFVISGQGDDATVRSCLDQGASDFIVKPFDFEYLELSLLAKIRTLV